MNFKKNHVLPQNNMQGLNHYRHWVSPCRMEMCDYSD